MEIWKDIPGYVGHYLVSNRGRVKSIKFKRSRILKQSINAGYPRVCLYINKKSKAKHVHLLMAMAFLDYEPIHGKICIDHIDNNPLNNDIENLRIISWDENLRKDRENKHGYRGVRSQHGKFAARIYINKKELYLGLFDTAEEASQAYEKALNKKKEK